MRCLRVTNKGARGSNLPSLRHACKAHSLNSELITGGSTVEAPERCDILIATPGRLDDLLSRAILDVSGVELLILDEADVLLELGFALQIDRIMKRLPRQRRTCLFSATQTRAVRDLARAGLRNPASVSVKVNSGSETGKTPTELISQHIIVRAEDKLRCALDLLKTARKSLVFFDSCAAVDFFGRALKAANVAERVSPIINALHGKMAPKKRGPSGPDFVNVLPRGSRCCARTSRPAG